MNSEICLIVFFLLIIGYVIYFCNNKENFKPSQEKIKINDKPTSIDIDIDVIPKLDKNELDNIIQVCQPKREFDSLYTRTEELCPIGEKQFEQYKNYDQYFNQVEEVNHFRDQMDPVNCEKNKFLGKKIKDIYDELTQNTGSCFAKKCLKKPYTDPYSGQKLYLSDITNKTFTNDQWEYKDENPLNGGPFFDNTYGYTPNDKDYAMSLS